jgi:hypothetical protein
MNRKLLQQALDALKMFKLAQAMEVHWAIAALEAELAKPEQEPERKHIGWENGERKYIEPPRKEWVGLNWDDIPDVFVGDIAFMQGAKWALAKLKEKNT